MWVRHRDSHEELQEVKTIGENSFVSNSRHLEAVLELFILSFLFGRFWTSIKL